MINRLAWATRFGAAVLALLISAAVLAQAETAIIGTRVSPTSLDPQLGGLGSDQGYYRHLYDALYMRDERLKSQPGLAVSYRLVDDLTWEFKLRQGVTFHDGSRFDAADVVFSFKRLWTVQDGDGLQQEKLRPVERIDVIDDFTIRIITHRPTPYLLKRLEGFWIISDTLALTTTTEQFNRGSAIGTGPFELVQWKRGNQLILKRNDQYWGARPDFSRVVLKEMGNDATRVAALQAGDIDMADFVPPLDTYRLKRMSSIEVFTIQSARVVFLQFDTLSETNPQVTDHAGRPLSPNPLRDNQVRQALKLAISKNLIVEKIMEGLADPANQGVPAGFEGHAAELPPDRYDKAAARQMLAKAGYPGGFQLTLSCPNDRYINDAIICQAIGQMWTQVGVRTHIDSMPKAVYFKKMLGGEYSAYMLGWGNTRGDSISFLKNVIHSRGGVGGGGTWNASYSNPQLDRQIDAAMSTMDESLRKKQLDEIMTRAVADNAFLPLHTQPVIVATRAGLQYLPVPGEETLSLLLTYQSRSRASD